MTWRRVHVREHQPPGRTRRGKGHVEVRPVVWVNEPDGSHVRLSLERGMPGDAEFLPPVDVELDEYAVRVLRDRLNLALSRLEEAGRVRSQRRQEAA